LKDRLSARNILKRKKYAPHHYTNDFAMRCHFINRGGHKIQLPHKYQTINGGGLFLFMEAVRKCLPPKIDLWRRAL
jgi:hypothetical protein